jgi:hypothetical protein
LRLIESKLPGFLSGLYLHGSIALGAFNVHLSDIDFIAFTSRRCTATDLAVLRAIHQTVATNYPRWALEGSYLQWADLGQLEESISPAPVYHDGKLVEAAKFDVNAVTWWVLKQRGVTLLGPPAGALDFEVDWPLLIARMKRNLNSYWLSYTRKPERIAWLFTDYGIQWTVLGVLRQYYTFVEQDITSKVGAGEYALAHLPAQWHRLIREALRIREQTQPSLYRCKAVRALAAYDFLSYLIRLSNQLA